MTAQTTTDQTTTTTIDPSAMTAEEIAALKDARRQEAWAALEYMMAMLSNAVVQAEADRQAWIAAGRPARLQSTTQTMSTSEMDSGQSGATFGFYRVVRNGVDIMGLSTITNAIVYDTIELPFEAGNSVGSLLSVNCLVDGDRYRGVTPLIEPNIVGGLIVDTSFLENGTHSFQVVADFLNPDIGDGNNYTLQQLSTPFTLNVSNIIYYPDWCDEVGELGFTTFNAKTTCTNANWQLDIYDVSNNLVKTLTGYATNGIIEATWNLVDTNGVARTNVDLDPEFNSMITVADPVSKAAPIKTAQWAYPTQGAWALAYQDIFFHMANSNMYYTAISDMIGVADDNGGAYSYLPVSPYTNGQTWPLRYPATNNPVTTVQMLADYYALDNLLTNSYLRNFYYNGHASGSTIAGFLDSSIIKLHLKKHYYRFVFLDACLTATGDLPAAFGINLKSAKPLTYFQRNGMRPRAFVGYSSIVFYYRRGTFRDSETGELCYGQVPEEVTFFLYEFEFYWWLYGYDLTTSISYAIRDTPYIGSDWETGQRLKVYGYENLLVDGYNHKSQWSY